MRYQLVSNSCDIPGYEGIDIVEVWILNDNEEIIASYTLENEDDTLEEILAKFNLTIYDDGHNE